MSNLDKISLVVNSMSTLISFIDDLTRFWLKHESIRITVIKGSAYSDKQRGALHVWCSLMSEMLNNAGLPLVVEKMFGNDTVEMDWDKRGEMFKRFIYKPMLEYMTGLRSTEDQSSVNPSDVSREIIRHFSNKLTPTGQACVCPAWPSKKG